MHVILEMLCSRIKGFNFNIFFSLPNPKTILICIIHLPMFSSLIKFRHNFGNSDFIKKKKERKQKESIINVKVYLRDIILNTA